MARADLTKIFTESIDTKPAKVSAAAPAPADKEAGDTRINFEIPKAKRAAFKAWCAQNDTTIRRELSEHIDRVLGA